MSENHDFFNTLVAYAANELDGETAEHVKAQLAQSPDAQKDYAMIREVLDLLASDDTLMPSAEVIRKAVEQYQQSRESAFETIRAYADRFIARLIFDSRAQPALPGFRGSGDGYHLLYACDLGEVDLYITQGSAVDQPVQVRGQVSGDSSPAMESEDLGGTSEGGGPDPATPHASLLIATPDRNGEFTLRTDPGRYDLHIRMTPKQTIVLEDVNFE